MEKRKKYKQGIFSPKNPNKWVFSKQSITDGKYIRFMSSWELKAMRFFDECDSILQIASEPFPITYISPKDNKPHRYYPDFLVKTAKEVFLVEIKPFKETQEPKAPKRNTQKAKANYINEVFTYKVNRAKWEAATEFCNKEKIRFIIITEKELKI